MKKGAAFVWKTLVLFGNLVATGLIIAFFYFMIRYAGIGVFFIAVDMLTAQTGVSRPVAITIVAVVVAGVVIMALSQSFSSQKKVSVEKIRGATLTKEDP